MKKFEEIENFITSFSGNNHSVGTPEKEKECERVHPLVVSSNINKVIRSVLNFLFFFNKKISQVQRSTKLLTANKNKICV